MSIYDDIDPGEAGSKGPWLNWYSTGSAMKQIQPATWVVNAKDENGQQTYTTVEGFKKGVVLDVDTLQFGYMKDGDHGPNKVWHGKKIGQRPSEDKRADGKGYAWTPALKIRCALSQTEDVTWEQSQYAAYQAFRNLVPLLKAKFPGDPALLPLVVQLDVQREETKNGTTFIPVLDVKQWVTRPPCLRADAPAIDPGPAPQQNGAMSAPAPAPQPDVTGQPAQAPTTEDAPW